MMNKKIKIILLVIVIIIIGIVTYFMISYNNYKKELENINIVNDAVEEYNNLALNKARNESMLANLKKYYGIKERS